MSLQLSVKGRRVGVLEYWSIGVMDEYQYSSIPLLHYSKIGIHT